MLNSIRYDSSLVDLIPELTVCCIKVNNIGVDTNESDVVKHNIASALEQLKNYTSESAIPSISFWRNAYRKVGIDPTKHRMAAESLLRRLRKQGELPQHLHPLVLLCNSLSVKHHIPIAALDADCISGNVNVTFTRGDERYTTFQAEEIAMPPEEVSFIDEDNVAHARKWSHKQSATSVITSNTSSVLITVETLLPTVQSTSFPAVEELIQEINILWPNSHLVFDVKSGHALKSNFF